MKDLIIHIPVWRRQILVWPMKIINKEREAISKEQIENGLNWIINFCLYRLSLLS